MSNNYTTREPWWQAELNEQKRQTDARRAQLSLFPPCDVHGCDMQHGETSYKCADERCTAKRICVGCSFNCFDCHKEFCERHVTDMLRGSTKYAEFVCDGCLRKRHDEKRAA